MSNKKIPRVNTSHKTLLRSVCEYFSDQSIGSPWRADYIVLRLSEEASNEYQDTIFIPNFNDKDNFEFYSPFKCNAFASDAVKIVTGVYQYRLAKRFGLVYGQQMQPIFYQDSTSGFATSDGNEKFLKGVNLIAHPAHMIIPPNTPISNVSKGSIAIHPSAHALLKSNFNNAHVSFNLYVVDLSLLV
jgi:hypothetical protein